MRELEDEQKQLQRIIENYIPGKTTYLITDNITESRGLVYECTLNIYKNGKEYAFKSFKFPRFLNSKYIEFKTRISDVERIVHTDIVINNVTTVSYCFDLENMNYIQLSEES